MLYKSLAMEIKTNTNDRTFTGYASKFGNVDLHNDIIEQGAFSKTISERHPKNMIKVLWQHMEPIGMPQVIQEDSDGLYVEGKISKTRLGDEAIELMRDRVVDGMSIGYDVVKDDTDKEKGIRYLKELKLYEVSIVTWGANPQAMITNVKQLQALNSIFKGDSMNTLDEIKALLDRLNDSLDGGVFGTKNGNLILNIEELKAGRVLSRKNRGNLEQAMGLIQTVLDTADETDNPKGRSSQHKKEVEPVEGETQDDFITRCMVDPEAVADFPDQESRNAYCVAQWEDDLDDDDDLEQNGKGAILLTDEFKSLLSEIRSYTKK